MSDTLREPACIGCGGWKGKPPTLGCPDCHAVALDALRSALATEPAKERREDRCGVCGAPVVRWDEPDGEGGIREVTEYSGATDPGIPRPSEEAVEPWCARCSGTGWTEGGKALKTPCPDCSAQAPNEAKE